MMSDEDFLNLKIGDDVIVTVFNLHTRYTLPAKTVGKSCSKIQVKYPDGRVSWKSKKVVMKMGIR